MSKWKKADKIRWMTDKAKHVMIDIRLDFLSRFGRKKLAIGIGGTALALILVVGAIALTGTEAPEETPQMVLSAEEEEASYTCYEILIDGSPIITMSSEEEANKVLDEVAAYYQTEGSELIDVKFKENVEIVEVQKEKPELIAMADAVTMLITGTKEPKTYTVQEGDNFWDISIKNGMTVDELIASNPQADPDHLKIGSVLNLYEVKPYIHLIMTERLTATEKIEYGVNYEETSTLYKGETQVKEAGVYGQRQVTKEIVKENGVIVSTTELESQVISEPKTQVVLKGTKSLSTLVGTGSFTSPMGHLEISSPYGSRGGGRHTGVDLRNPRGTPIYVVDDGVVTHAAYRGSYGNLVKVSHGNGIETWYAHCDKMLVKIGDVVKKGNKIATVGATGRATGYHLHFEVRKNGVPQNPMNYL